MFKARALLYSQRLVTRDPESPFALWNRAFVRALAGMHLGARNDLNQAKRKAAAAGQAVARPGWVKLIDAYLRYDTRSLKLEDGPLVRLAALLRVLAVEFPSLRAQRVPFSRELLEQEPDCARAIDILCETGDLGDIRAATEYGPQVLDEVLPKKLLAMTSLPASVRAKIERGSGEPAVVDALRKAGKPGDDSSEPSWSVLAHLIEETRFSHVLHRLIFMREIWGVPVDDYWAEMRPFVANHRYGPYLESFTVPPDKATQILTEFLAKLDLTEIEAK